eukprot:Gb_09935 [translate_table: standard]
MKTMSLTLLYVTHWALLYALALCTEFAFNRFERSNLTLITDASILSGVLRLTNDSQFSIGQAVYPFPLRFKNGKNTTASSFSTTFIFSLAPHPPYTPGHGLAFILTPSKHFSGVISAEYFGLFNTSTNGRNDSHLFAVEFDTLQNPEFEDINNNHVGVDLDSLESVNSTAAGYWTSNHVNHPFEFRPLNLKSGQNIQAWVEYDGIQKHLNVTISPIGVPRPLRPLLSQGNIDLSDVLEDEMYAGFSAATGTAVESHNVLAWSFSINGVAKRLDTSHLPSFLPREKHSKFSSRGFIAAVCVVSISFLFVFVFVVALFRWYKRGERDESIEEWELEYWPHRFTYRELNKATKGFSEERLIGSGGFGRVYRGIFPNNGLEVAVKTVSHDSKQGIREFIAEISSLGRLQHRNLVQLRGWCKNKKELFLVYDYMPNRSLDRMIFENPRPLLAWPERFRVLKGVASGLLYLHEEWEQRVLHRDVKASNVMLDAEFNGRLGDFGLARMYDHGIHSRTTHVVGTLGYLAPELVRTGKATTSTDVFSFGALLLEVACGRRPIEPNRPPEELLLVDWVWELFRKNNILAAADPKLSGEYVVEEMEKVLELGVVCSHPEAEVRPGMRQVLQILEEEGRGGMVLPGNMDALDPAWSRRVHGVGFDQTAGFVESSQTSEFVESNASYSTVSFLSGRS